MDPGEINGGARVDIIKIEKQWNINWKRNRYILLLFFIFEDRILCCKHIYFSLSSLQTLPKCLSLLSLKFIAYFPYHILKEYNKLYKSNLEVF